MSARLLRVTLALVAMLAAAPVMAQFTVLDQAQDASSGSGAPTVPPAPPAPPPICGTQPITIARMSWPSAELLAEIHARVLAREYGCETRVAPGDMSATGSSMSSTGQPAVAPEMWATRIPDVWNAGIAAQMLRPAAPTYADSQFEGWFVPGFVKAAHPELNGVAQLAAVVPQLAVDGQPLRFISCPIDWACALINRNLVTALGLGNVIELVEPANRFEMDTLIAEAMSRREAFLFYYWQPNAVLAQFGFTALDMGSYDNDAAKCLARLVCEQPVPSAFVAETVVVALSEWVFTDTPAIAAYFQRTSLPLAEMNKMLAQLNEPGATIEGVADRFVAERADIWRNWVSSAAP